MIFVTTGSTKQSSYYLPLIEKLEQLKKDDLIQEDIVIQAGYAYFESDMFKEIFDFTTDFESYIDKAEIVITADGAGTIFDLLRKNKKTIVVPNVLASRYGAPAEDFIGGFERDGNLVWCKDINNILEDIEIAKNKQFSRYQSPNNNISESIMKAFDNWKSNAL